MTLPVDGRYVVAVWHPGGAVGRYTFVIGDKERPGGDLAFGRKLRCYWTPVPTPAPDSSAARRYAVTGAFGFSPGEPAHRLAARPLPRWWHKRPPFFEGWYFKLVDAGEDHRYAVIPGVFIGREPGSSHTFVQTLDGTTGRTTYHRYPFESFRADRSMFDIQVGPNRFRADAIALDIDSPERQIRGELRFSA